MTMACPEGHRGQKNLLHVELKTKNDNREKKSADTAKIGHVALLTAPAVLSDRFTDDGDSEREVPLRTYHQLTTNFDIRLTRSEI